MKEIIQANIDRYKKLLETTTEPTKRVMIIRLCAEEEAKLKPIPDDKKQQSNY